uniref:Potassium voltage-gated channel subfamily E member 3-like protein n=1 Tax=Callorhinchus milii TaxID=7868 RepID=V9KT13_CALMI
MNKTAVFALLATCISKILKEPLDKGQVDEVHLNVTASEDPERNLYENSYFFVIFVMLFYSFLALTVFFGYMRSKNQKFRKDPYEEYLEEKDSKKYVSSFAFDLEDESML